MSGVEAAHKAEVKALQNKWNNVILPNLENQIALLEMELKKRQQQELDEFRDQIEQGPASVVRVKYSSMALDMEKKMMHLSNIGLYKEAKVIKKQLKTIKADEKGKNMSEARAKLLCKS
jgi:hypothetical protein